MCEHARFAILAAFRNIREPGILKPMMAIKTVFAMRLTQALRRDPAFSGIVFNAHNLEDETAEAIQRFAGHIKAGTLDVDSFYRSIAEGIMKRLINKPLTGSLDALLRVIRDIPVDGQRNLGVWLRDWADMNQGNFVGNLTDTEIHDEAHSMALDAAEQEIISGAGVTDPKLCG